MDRHQFDTSKIEVAEQLADLAFKKVTARLRSFGNGLSPKHERALRELLAALSSQGLGINPGRFAYALPCGAGKTQCVIAWIAAATELGLGLSVAVSASQIAALFKIKQDLIEAGVPPVNIGLRHSKGKNAAEPDTGDEDRPIMLVSHERIRRGAGVAPAVCMHRGAPRDLLIWDESLMVAEATALSWPEVDTSIRLVTRLLLPSSSLRAWLQRSSCDVQREMDAQGAGAMPSVLTLSDGLRLDEAQQELHQLGRYGTRLRRGAIEAAGAYIRLAQQPVSVALTGNGLSGEGLIHFAVAVDPELANIAILDASFPIRTLAQGGGIEDGTTPAMRTCKTYERVTVQQVNASTGKTTLESDPKKKEALADQIAEVVGSVPPDESVLIFTFKDDSKQSMREVLASKLVIAGVDLKERLNGALRIEWLTWGSETSWSEYSHCQHVILAGVLRRNPLELAASMAARHEDLRYRVTRQHLQDVQMSEMAHCVLQAMNRGTCRNVDEAGLAHAMTLTIFANADGLKEALADSLPGVQWDMEEARKSKSCTRQTAFAVRDYLRGLSPEETKLSIRAIKKAVPSKLKRDAWQDALAHGLVLAKLGDQGVHWERDKQSIRRVMV